MSTVLLDTNILLRYAQPADALNGRVVRHVEQLRAEGVTLYFAPQNAVEFWNVATRPANRNGFGLTPTEAATQLDLLDELFTMLPETPALYPAWRALVQTVGVSGVQVHDARLVAWMQTHGIQRLLTLNPADFHRYAVASGLVVMVPSLERSPE